MTKTATTQTSKAVGDYFRTEKMQDEFRRRMNVATAKLAQR